MQQITHLFICTHFCSYLLTCPPPCINVCASVASATRATPSCPCFKRSALYYCLYRNVLHGSSNLLGRRTPQSWRPVWQWQRGRQPLLQELAGCMAKGRLRDCMSQITRAPLHPFASTFLYRRSIGSTCKVGQHVNLGIHPAKP